MATPSQHHHKEPSLLDFTGVLVDGLGTFAEVNLRGVTGREVQHRCQYRGHRFDAAHYAYIKRVSSPVAMGLAQQAVHDPAVDVDCDPLFDPISVRLQRGHRSSGGSLGRIEQLSQRGIFGQTHPGFEPTFARSIGA